MCFVVMELRVLVGLARRLVESLFCWILYLGKGLRFGGSALSENRNHHVLGRVIQIHLIQFIRNDTFLFRTPHMILK